MTKRLKQESLSGPNQIGRANRRLASALIAGRQFESASCAPPPLSAGLRRASLLPRGRQAAVARLWR